MHSAPRRRRHSPDVIERIVAEYRGGTSTQREVAERHGICVATLQNWLRKAESLGSRDGDPRWIEVIAEAPASSGSYRIELPRGRALVLGARWRPEEVRQLVSLLSLP